MKKCVACAIMVIVTLLAACGPAVVEKPSPPPEPPQSFAGYTVPGKATDAKAQGFTDCAANTYTFDCKQPKPKPFFGAQPTEVSVGLNGENNMVLGFSKPKSEYENKDVRTVPFERLSYRSVYLRFENTTHNDDCKPRDHTCEHEVSTRAYLERKLSQAGWIRISDTVEDEHFIHPQSHIEINAEFNGTLLSITTLSSQEHTNELSQAQADAKMVADQKKAEDAILQKMKQ